MLPRRITPAVLALCPLLACCLLATVLETRVLLPAAAACVFGAVAVSLFHCETPRLRRAGVSLAALSFGSILGLAMVLRMGSTASLPFPVDEVTGFSGTLTQDSLLSRESRTMVRVSFDRTVSATRSLSADARGRALVVIDGDYRFSLGQSLLFRVPRAALKPFDSQGPERYVAFVRRNDLRSLGFSSPVWRFRASLREGIHRSLGLAGYPASALLEALLVGSREDVPPELSEGFRRTGSLHILALSGLHAGIIYGFAFLFLGFVGNKALKLALAILALAFYQLLAGPIPSLLRATLMLAAGGAVLLCDRDVEPINILAISGIVILLWDPYQAGSLSFQLSFLAILGIISVGPLIARPLEGRMPPLILGPLSMSLGAQLATLPVVLSAFGAYYPSGILAGLLLVPLTTSFLWLGLVWLLVSPLLGMVLSRAAAALFAVIYRAVSDSARFFSAFPGIAIEENLVPWVSLASAIVLVLACFFSPGRRQERAHA